MKKIINLLIIALLFNSTAKAQIVYTDVVPDVVCYMNGSSYKLDLNNDGTYDFNLYIIQTGTSPHINQSIRITPLNSNEIVGGSTSSFYPLELNSNIKIDSNTLHWSGNTPQTLRGTTWSYISHYNPKLHHTFSQWVQNYSGNWTVSNTDRYLGLKLKNAGNTYYGWIRMQTNLYLDFKVEDYAYNSIPNQPILAGQTIATGINEIGFQTAFSIYPNPATNSIAVNFPSDNAGELSIVNLYGEVVFTEKTNVEEMKVDVSKFSSGMYMARWNSGEHFAMQKFSIIK